MPGGSEIEEAIGGKSVDFCDVMLEQQVLKYAIGGRSSILLQCEVDWFSDVIFQYIFKVIIDLRLQLSQSLLFNELRDRGWVPKRRWRYTRKSLRHCLPLMWGL